MSRALHEGRGAATVRVDPGPLLGSAAKVDAGGGRLRFAGRLHNRRELARDLGLAAELPAAALAGAVSRDALAAVDGRLAAAAWRRWGEACLDRFIGPFTLLVEDRWSRRVLVARDALGEMGVCYHHAAAGFSSRDRPLLVVAADEADVLAHPAVPSGVDDETVLRFLAVEPPAAGATFHAHVRELPPGHLLRANAQGVTLEPWYQPALDRERRDDGEWAEIFAATLEEAVVSALDGCGHGWDGAGRAGVMMSGGLDSGSVAMLAARRGAATAAGPLPVFTWRFAELAACDEGPWVDALVRHGGLDPHPVAGDDAWPLAGTLADLAEPGRPPGNAYRPLKQRLYAAAQAAGVDVLLTGAAGDQLWAGGRRGWLGSLLAEGRWATAVAQTAGHLAHRRTGDLLHGAAGLARLPWRAPDRPWLRPEAARRLADLTAADPSPASIAELRYAAVAGPRVARGVSGEALWARRAGIELRDPYRDRRLVELALSLPGHLLRRDGLSKHLLRTAMVGLLPEAVRRRPGSTSLLPLFRRGVVEREGRRVAELLDRRRLWSRHVEPAWLAATRRDLHRLTTSPGGHASGRLAGPAGVALWHCLSAELWAELWAERGERVPQAAAAAIAGAGAENMSHFELKTYQRQLREAS